MKPAPPSQSHGSFDIGKVEKILMDDFENTKKSSGGNISDEQKNLHDAALSIVGSLRRDKSIKDFETFKAAVTDRLERGVITQRQFEHIKKAL